MLPNDYARCPGAVTETIDPDTRTTSLFIHPQCHDCQRRIDVLPDTPYPGIDAPLGLLADEDQLCPMRESM
jgi:hypothetical protein